MNLNRQPNPGRNPAGKAAPQPVRPGVELSIICVNWNSAEYLKECIQSIRENLDGLSHEIIVVDNASPEGGIDALEEEFPEIRLIRSAKNLGFAGANNLGFEHAEGSLILFLNPDTHILGPAIQIMAAHLRAVPDAGVVGCRLLNTDRSVQTSCIQTFPTIWNQLLDLDLLRRLMPNLRMWGTAPLFQNPEGPVKVEVISGACMMLHREVFEAIGRFTTEYFMYAEDLDLCYKSWQKGFSNYYIPNASVIHHGQKSSSKLGGSRQSVQWAMEMRCNSVHMFCARNRGQLYASVYRMAMAFSASARALLLAAPAALARLSAGKDSHRELALAKWSAALGWSLGLRGQSSASGKTTSRPPHVRNLRKTESR